MLPMAVLLGRRLQPLQRLPGSSSISISSAAQGVALRRAQHAGVDAFYSLVNGDLQQWESMVCAGLAAGMSLEVGPAAGVQLSVLLCCC